MRHSDELKDCIIQISSKEKEMNSIHDERTVSNSKNTSKYSRYIIQGLSAWHMGSGCLEFNSGPHTYYLCDPGQGTVQFL